jgi:hypothetical protein
MLLLLSLPGDVLDDWMDNDDGTVIGSVQKEEDGSFSVKGSRGDDFNTTLVSHEHTDMSYSVINTTRPDDHLGEITSVRAHKLKRRYDDFCDTMDTKVVKRIQRVNSDRLRKLNRRSLSSSLSMTPRSSSRYTPANTPQLPLDPFYELQEKKQKQEIYKSVLSRDQQDFVIDEVIRIMKTGKTTTFTLKSLMIVDSLKDISRKDMIDPLKEIAIMRSGLWTLRDNYKSMYGL